MFIRNISINNFRLLEKVDLSLDGKTTVIVGRNNSGKTSLAELFRRLLSENSLSFDLEDFSLGVHSQFWNAFDSKKQGKEDDEIRKVLPVIEVKLIVEYDKNATSFGPLSDFIIDLNPDCVDVKVVISYQLEDGKIAELLGDIELDAKSADEKKTIFYRTIKERIPKYYKPIVYAEDPNDPTNKKTLDGAKLKLLLQSGFINAQRGLDDREKDVLGKILEVLFSTAMSTSAASADRGTAQKLEDAIQGIQSDIDLNFNEQLKNLLPAFSIFGYPGLSDPKLCTETMLDVERLLSNHTKVRYFGENGVHLPESYNGLGTRNLIYILLKLLEFYKSFKAKQPSSGVHLVFIEEPEAHLHPQMQEVFINKISEIAKLFAEQYDKDHTWPVQFIITTHSSHIANMDWPPKTGDRN